MADSKISALTAASSIASGDLIPIVQGGTNKKLDYANFGIVHPSPGMRTGQKYGAFNSSGAASTTAMNSNKMYAVPVLLGAGTYTSIECEVTTGAAAGKLLRMAIYNSSNGVPSSLVVDAGTVAADSIAVKTLSINQVLSGWYWLVLWSDGSPTVRREAINSKTGLLGATSLTAAYTAYYYQSLAFGTAPLTFGAVTDETSLTETPRIVVYG